MTVTAEHVLKTVIERKTATFLQHLRASPNEAASDMKQMLIRSLACYAIGASTDDAAMAAALCIFSCE